MSATARPLVIIALALLVLLPGGTGAARADELACAPPYSAANTAELNAAIACVNASGSGQHIIVLTSDITLTGPLDRLDNPAATELLIDGDGHVLAGGDLYRILEVGAGTVARIRWLTLSHGRADRGGAVLNQGTLTVEDSRIANSSATRGGGIYSVGSVYITGSTLSNNRADYGGAVALQPGTTEATLTMRNSAVSGNAAVANGGGILVFSSLAGVATASLANTVVDGNESVAGTGGLDVIAAASSTARATLSATLIAGNEGGRGGLALIADGGLVEATLSASTLAGNRSTGDGGGAWVRAVGNGTATLTLFNATVSGNSAAGAGGGLLVSSDGSGARANAVYTTLAGNTATAGGGGIHASGSRASVTLSASLVHNGSGAGPDCAAFGGSVISTGYNLDGDNTCSLIQGSDLPATAPGLLPLGPNVPGNTPTHALRVTSPALDRVHFGAIGCGTAAATDQRGTARPQPAGGRCDIGAFERRSGDTPEWHLWLAVVSAR